MKNFNFLGVYSISIKLMIQTLYDLLGHFLIFYRTNFSIKKKNLSRLFHIIYRIFEKI